MVIFGTCIFVDVECPYNAAACEIDLSKNVTSPDRFVYHSLSPSRSG